MNITLYTATSLDGFIARPDGSVDWCFTDADYGLSMFAGSVDGIIMGRRSWEKLRDFNEAPDREKRYYVMTHRPLETELPNVVAIAGSAVEVAARAAEDGCRHVWLFGGGDVNSQFAAAGLIRDVIAHVHPVALGHGIRLFAELDGEMALELCDSTHYESGMVRLHYRAGLST
jgi:dihydrofolate reductase